MQQDVSGAAWAGGYTLSMSDFTEKEALDRLLSPLAQAEMAVEADAMAAQIEAALADADEVCGLRVSSKSARK